MALVSSSSGGGGEAMLCRITQSHWKEGEMVPTYFVSQKPRKGHFQRLKDALQQAPMYSRIEIVGGGVFREKIVIDKPLEIGVAKAAEMPTIINKGTGVVCQVDEALLEGVRVEAEDSSTPCVTIVRGSPKIRWCTLQAVEVSGTASPTIEECKILDSKTHGLFLTDRATGTYTKNSIWGHSGYSVQIESRAEPTLSYNVIAGSDLGQVCIQDDPEDPARVAPYLLLNRISDDREVSKDVSGGTGSGGGGAGSSDPFSKAAASGPSNTVNENGVLPAHKLEALPVKRVGMKVAILPSQHLNVYSADFEEETSDDPALMDSVTVEHCAVLITGSHTQPTLVRNTIASCKQHGLTVKSGASGLYETNYVSANKGWGVLIQGDNTAPVFKANHVGSNGGGVRVLGSPASFVNGNSLFGNRGPQLLLHDGHDRFVCEGNTIKSGNRTGVLCTGVGAGTFRRNHFDGCAIAVRVESLADPLFDHDVFEQCRIGVYVREGGLGHFTGCHITDIILYGALVMSLGNPVFHGCQFVFNETGAVVMRRGRGTFEGCCFRDCRECGMDVSTESHPIVTRCEIKTCQRGGVRVRFKGRGEFSQNLMVRNHDAQLLIDQGGDPVVTANVIGFTEADGVRVLQGGLGTLTDNVVQSCYQSGVVVAGATSAPVVRANQISDCGLCGIQLTDGRLGMYEKNVITRCCRACISVEGYAVDSQDRDVPGGASDAPQAAGAGAAAARRSTAHHQKAGVTESDQQTIPVVLRGNLLYHTSCCGVIAERRASVLMHKNVLRHHQQGVIVRGASDVVMIKNIFRDCTHGVCADEESALQLFVNAFTSIRGTAVASLSTCLFQARGNAFTDCGTALLLRRVGRGACLENVVRQSPLYGILLGSDCRCVVKRNILFDNRVGISFSELHNRADVLDNCVVHSHEQGIRVAGDAMDAARCHLNVVLSSKIGLFVRLGSLKLDYNLFLNCDEGVHINAVPGKNAAAAASSSGGGAVSSPGDTLAGTMGSAKRALHKVNNNNNNNTASSGVGGSSPQAAQDLVQTGGGPSAALQYCYVGCCSRGGVAAVGGGSVVQIERTIFTHNDIGFHVDGARASVTLLRGNVICNSAAAGFYAQACPTKSCLLEDCALFKNFMNVVSVEGAAPDLRRCVLEAPVVFNVFVSGVRTSPHFSGCVMCPRVSLANVVATAAAATHRSKANTTNGNGNGTLAGQSIEALLRAIVEQYAIVMDPAATGTRGGGASSRFGLSQAPRQISFENANPRTDAEASLSVGADRLTQWLLTPSLWADHYAEPLAWQRESERDRAVDDARAALQTARDRTRAQLLVRRSAILWPSNVESPNVLGGPGGPFIVHRMRVRAEGALSSQRLSSSPEPGGHNGDDKDGDDGLTALQRHRFVDAQHRDDYLYSCSGVWLEHASTPVMEGCYIGEHVSVGTGYDRPVALPEEHSWSLAVLPFLGEVRGGPAAKSVAQLRASEALAPLTAAYVPPLPSVTTDTLLGQLLLVGSPCFWRRHAVTPLFFHEQCALLAEAVTEPVAQLVRKRQFEDFAAPSIHFGATFTAHLVGTGVFARHYAEGDFQNCTLARNTAGCRLSMGAKTCFKACQMTANASEAFVLEGRCVAAIQSCTFRDGHQTQIKVLGVETSPVIKHNTFIATPFTSIVVCERASPHIASNQFVSVQSAAVLVETQAEPFIEKNQFEYCQCGVEYRSGARGRLERNHFKASTHFAVLVKDAETAPAVVGNTMLDTRIAAVQVEGYGAQPYLEDNALTANDIGIRLQGGAQGTYTRNTLRKHRQGVIVESSQGQFRSNHIAETHLEGFLARGTHCAPVLLLNRIQDGESVALRWDCAQGQIARNRLLHNAEDGCVIEGAAASPSVVANEVAYNGGVGVRVSSGSTPALYCNVIASNSGGGVCVQDGDTNPVLEGDYVKANQKFGVLFDKKALGSLSGCVVSATTDGAAVVIDDGASPVMQESAIVNNTASGIVVRSGARLQASRCLLAHNRCRQAPAYGAAALVIASSEEGTCVAGCVFLENDVSVLAQRGARVEFMACGFLGAHSGSAAVRVQAEAAPLFTHCLFASTRCAVLEEGAGRYTRCEFMECAAGADVSGPCTFYECEFLECGTGLRVAAGGSTIMGCIFASCGKIGLHLTSDARPSVGECGILRNTRGLVADGAASGTVSKSRILWNTDNVVINDQATTTLSSNLIYDGVNSGVLVRGGAPTISNNDIFDNHYAGVTVEAASGGRLEENRVSFAREDGALVVRNEKESLAVAANTLRNSFSPPANSQFRNANERQLGYRKLGTEKEKDSVTFAALRSFLDEIVSVTMLRITTLQSRTVAAASNKEWLVQDSDSAATAGSGSGTGVATATPPTSGRKSRAGDSPSPGGEAKEPADATAAAAADAPAEEPVSAYFEPLFTRWEKLAGEVAAAARCIGFAHLSADMTAAARPISASVLQSPPTELPSMAASSSSRRISASPRGSGADATDGTRTVLPPIGGPPNKRRVTRQGLSPAVGQEGRRPSHVDASDESSMMPTPAAVSPSRSSPPHRLDRPTTKAGEVTPIASGMPHHRTVGEREDLLPASVALVVLFYAKRALQKQLDQLQGTLNATPSHLYTTVLHRTTLQTVSAVLDSDAFRSVFELRRAVVGAPVPAARGHTQRDTNAMGNSTNAPFKALAQTAGHSTGASKKKRKGSSVVAADSGGSGSGRAALRLPSISGNRGATRKGSAASINSGASTSLRRANRTKRASGSTLLGDSTAGKQMKHKKKKKATAA